MHWKKHSDGLCIVGLGGGIQNYPTNQSALIPRTPGRLTTLYNSQRLFATPAPTKKRSSRHSKSAPNTSLPDIPRDSVSSRQAEIGIHGTAKAIHPNFTSPREVIASPAGPEWVTAYKMRDYANDKIESKSNKLEKVSSTPRCFYVRDTGQPALRTRSVATSSISSLGDLSVTSVSLSSRNGSRRGGLDTGNSSNDSENTSDPTDRKSVPQAPRERPERGIPRRSPGTFSSKLFRMTPSLEQNEPPSVQTIELEKGNTQSFKKLLVLTQLPNTSKPGKPKAAGDSGVPMSDSPVTSLSSSSNDSSHRERNMVMDLHSLSRQHASRRNSNQSERTCSDTAVLDPESGHTVPEDRQADDGLVNQWLGACPPLACNRLEPDSMRRQIVLSVPSIEEEAET